MYTDCKKKKNKTKGNGEILSMTFFSIFLVGFLLLLISFIQMSTTLNKMQKTLQSIARAVAVSATAEDAMIQAETIARMSMEDRPIENLHVYIAAVGEEDASDWNQGLQKKVIISCDINTIEPFFTSGTKTKATLVTLEAASRGENAIPEEYEGHSVGTGNVYTVTHNYGTRNWAHPCRRIWEVWVNKGSVYTDNVATIDGKYLIACASTMGTVGDWITWYFDDGSKIESIMADTKSSGDPNYTKWGHIHSNIINVIEFETNALIHPGTSGCIPQIAYKRAVGWTNHGRVY